MGWQRWVQQALHENPLAGDISVVRAKRADRVCFKICQVVGYMRFLSTCGVEFRQGGG
jgi:hypothetical protein